jgi:chromosome segregation ATPase
MDKFDILEEKINQLVDAYSALRREKDSLEERIIEKESEIHKLNERIDQFSRERDMAREKVEGLLHRVERLIASPAGMGKG